MAVLRAYTRDEAPFKFVDEWVLTARFLKKTLVQEFWVHKEVHRAAVVRFLAQARWSRR